jgi:hypothetical protein
MEQHDSHLKGFHEIRYLRILWKSVPKIQVSLKSDKNKGFYTWKTDTHFSAYLAHFSLEWEMFQPKVAENINKHFALSNTFFF